MGCLIYPNFPVEVPDTLKKVLNESGKISLLEYACHEYNSKKMGGGKHFVVHRSGPNGVEKPLSFWIRELSFNRDVSGDPVVKVEADSNQSEMIEDAYIARDLQFIIRGRVLRYKDTGGLQAVQLSHIEPLYKSKTVTSEDSPQTLADKLLGSFATVNKSASFASPALDPALYPKSASYLPSVYAKTGSKYDTDDLMIIDPTIANTKKSVKVSDIDWTGKNINSLYDPKINIDAVCKIFQDLIDGNGNAATNPLAQYVKNLAVDNYKKSLDKE